VFIDRARLVIRGGDGGRGVISFRREAHVPRGGPDGGDGGKGGDVVLRVDAQLGTLTDFRFAKEIEAHSGKPGGGRNSSGRSGADRILFATDDPFDLGPAFLPTLESGILSKADLDKVYRANAERILQLGGPG